MSARVRRPGRPRARLAAPAGFTLVEAATALVVVGFGAAAALGADAAAVRAESRLEHVTAAEALGQQRLATLRLLTRAQLLRLPDSLARGAFAPPLDRYHWRATSVLAPGEADLFALRVELTWDEGATALETRHYAPRLLLQGR